MGPCNKEDHRLSRFLRSRCRCRDVTEVRILKVINTTTEGRGEFSCYNLRNLAQNLLWPVAQESLLNRMWMSLSLIKKRFSPSMLLNGWRLLRRNTSPLSRKNRRSSCCDLKYQLTATSSDTNGSGSTGQGMVKFRPASKADSQQLVVVNAMKLTLTRRLLLFHVPRPFVQLYLWWQPSTWTSSRFTSR